MTVPISTWIAFNIFIAIMLAIDLGVFHRKARIVDFKESLLWSGFWISLALIFTFIIHWTLGAEASLNFFTGYLIEESLSIDNLFVILLIFTYFRVPEQYLHRVLFWGIIGALVMRALFIIGGVALVHKFHWVLYFFGAFLIYTGLKLALQKNQKIDPYQNPIIKLMVKWIPFTQEYDEDNFFIKKGSQYLATPLFLVLLAIESTDLIFAMDSIPAIMAITLDPFIIYTSNVFAILGLRSIFFALSGLMRFFHYLHYGLACILVFVGAKMLLVNVYKVPIVATLLTISVVLCLSILFSLLFPKKENEILK